MISAMKAKSITLSDMPRMARCLARRKTKPVTAAMRK